MGGVEAGPHPGPRKHPSWRGGAAQKGQPAVFRGLALRKTDKRM